MKQLIYILLTTTILGLMSCSDWLDVSPKTSIPTDKQFESESGFKDALTGIYLKLGTKTLYAGDLTYAYLDELAGLYSDYPGYNTNAVFNQSIVFDYENMFLSKKNGIYSAMYNIIANINNFLEHVDKNKDVLVTERYYETMKGEALGLRAFLHFDLLRMFGPIYKEHPTSKAIPYRIAFDKDATPVLPASEVVDAILKDLNDAEKLLKGSDPLDFFTDQTDEDFIDKNHFLVNREFRMNLYAVKSMLARVYCYKGDAESKELATEYAKQVIAASKYFTLYKSQTASNYNSIPLLIILFFSKISPICLLEIIWIWRIPILSNISIWMEINLNSSMKLPMQGILTGEKIRKCLRLLMGQVGQMFFVENIIRNL